MRPRLAVPAVAVVVAAVCLAAVPAASAATGAPEMQRLAAEQTKLLFRELKGPQVASPLDCKRGQRENGILGVFMLPTLSFGSGDRTFHCRTARHTVLLDQGGGIATEDNRPDSTWTFEDESVVDFNRANLDRICDDVLARFFSAPAPATVDGARVTTGTAIATKPFIGIYKAYNPGTWWEDSIALGHPGRLATTYCGWKAPITLAKGRHEIAIDLSAVAGAPTRFTYDILVTR